MRAGSNLVWIVLALSIQVLPIRTADAQHCSGLLIEIGATEQRCLQPGSGDSFKDCADCPEMVAIPAGRYTMGAQPDEKVATEREDRAPVTIADPFAVGRFAVTRREFAAFVAATEHKIDGGCYNLSDRKVSDRSWSSPGFAQHDAHPVVCVSWNDAKAYVAWLSSMTGKSYRLLSEAEREYVTRAGSVTPFWWGGTISTDQANYDGNISYADDSKGSWRKATVPVDSFIANAWGLYNVHGNVWEWTEDCWNEKNAGNVGDGTARASGDCTLRVIRGAGFNNAPHTLRSARREREPVGIRRDTLGLRVARALRPI
ncbi:MAG: formylglycine-generating enzyme family protein [Bradyrhizobium sp.]|jgi:formylglycine-generating enzyme required for sulfatase activity